MVWSVTDLGYSLIWHKSYRMINTGCILDMFVTVIVGPSHPTMLNPHHRERKSFPGSSVWFSSNTMDMYYGMYFGYMHLGKPERTRVTIESDHTL